MTTGLSSAAPPSEALAQPPVFSHPLLLADQRIALPLSMVPVLLCSLPNMTLSAPCRGPQTLFIDSVITPWFARTLFWCISHIFHAKVDDSPGQSCLLVSDRHRWVSGAPEDHKKICFYWEMTSRIQCKLGSHAVLERDSVHRQSGAGLLSSPCYGAAVLFGD